MIRFERTTSDKIEQRLSSQCDARLFSECELDRPPAQKSHSGEIIPGEFIVVLKGGYDLNKVLSDHRIIAGHTFSHALNGFSAGLSPERLRLLKADPRIGYIEPNKVVQIDPQERPTKVWRSFDEEEKQIVPTGVSRIGGLLSKTAKIDGKDERVNVDVAVIDTGIDLHHPDLNVYRNVSFVKKSNGGDDDQGHGTHVAGIIAALDNNFGVVGVAPGARLWAVKVIDGAGSGSVADVIAGVDYVTEHANEIAVANMSLGLKGKSPALEEAITKSVGSGVTYVVAAGNDHEPCNSFCPADNLSMITTTAFGDSNGRGGGGPEKSCVGDPDDYFAEFSNYDYKNIDTAQATPVEISAPGICIVSTAMGQTYESRSGTSMAAPHTAGAACLYKAVHPKATPAQVREALIKEGKLQSDPNWGFGGDPDNAHEHVLFVGGL